MELFTANERASHAARLRNELSQDAFEQKDYLKKVERARVEREKQEKKRKRNEKLGLTSSNNDDDNNGGGEQDSQSNNSKKNFTFKQRAPILKDVRDQSSSSSSVASESSGKRKREDGKNRSSGVRGREMKGGLGIDAKKELSGVLSKIF